MIPRDENIPSNIVASQSRRSGKVEVESLDNNNSPQPARVGRLSRVFRIRRFHRSQRVSDGG